jgi:hypothetical protein
MTEQDHNPADVGLLRVSRRVKDRIDAIQAEMAAELGRRVTQTEVVERLLANQWGCPDEGR